MDQKQKRNVELFQILLRLKDKAVGIKFLRTEDDYERDTSQAIKKTMPYCVAVRCAVKGHAIKLSSRTNRCPGSNRALGLCRPEEDYYSGERGYSLGLYKDQSLAEKVAKDFCICKETCYGVAVKPLDDWTEQPDCVLVIADAYRIMRIVQGYAYHFGVQPHFNMTGNQGICIECTSNPYCNDTLNVSMLCSGTRYNAGWGDDMLGVGMSYAVFERIVDGLYQTVNSTEPDEKKKAIQRELQKKGYHTDHIRIGEAYYMK